jgi:hypothetical protein
VQPQSLGVEVCFLKHGRMHDKNSTARDGFVAGKVGLGWGYDHAKPKLEGTNVRPKNFRSFVTIIRLPAIVISRTEIGEIS